MTHSHRLTTAVDRLTVAVDTLLALLPPEQAAASVAPLLAFRQALGDLMAEGLGAASAQSAGALVTLYGGIDERLKALEAEMAELRADIALRLPLREPGA